MLFKQLYEDMGSLKADSKNAHEKLDRIITLIDDQCVKQDEFKLFKRISFSAASVFVGAIAFIFSKTI